MVRLIGLILALLAYLLLAMALAHAARKVRARAWVYAGLLILAGLFVPTAMLTGNYLSALPQPVRTLLRLALFLWPSLALFVAAWLLRTSMTLFRERQRMGAAAGAGSNVQERYGDRAALAVLVLSVVLFAKTLHNIYWLLVWDSTYDPLEFLWLVVPVMAAFLAGITIGSLSGKVSPAGFLYGPLMVVLMLIVYAGAGRVDFRRLTEERAARANQAIEAYHAREGRYPQDLRQAIPRYAISLPGPVIIYGQDWCYDAGDGYYRLGYVYRDHWSSPDLSANLYAGQGVAPDLPALCEAEIAALSARRSSHW